VIPSSPLPSPFDVTFRPTAAWVALRAADPSWTRSLLEQALPLALLPALAWPLGQASSGRLAGTFEALAASFLATLLFSLATILLFAAGLFVLSPFFEAPRHWGRCVALAAFSASPVLIVGALLVVPVLVVACVAACVHALALSYLGARHLLGCPESDAAFFVAAACMFALVSSMLLGGLCSAAGLI
jgi:hypothetical protein